MIECAAALLPLLLFIALARLNMDKSVKLVLSGSGTLYPAHVGAVIRLAEAGYVFEEVIGTSGGSIIGAALASGYKPNRELVEVIKKTIPSKNGLVDPSIWSLFSKWGFIKGEKMEALFKKFFAKTFEETVIPLHVVTCNIDKGELRIFSSTQDPKFSISTAVRASIAIPGLFVPAVIDNDRYVDGGLGGNFMIDHWGKDANVIGIKFTSAGGSKNKIKNAFDYTKAAVNLMLESNTAERIEDVENPKVINIRSKHDGMNLTMTEADVLAMIEEGYSAADKWLARSV
jgi:NTE family protein